METVDNKEVTKDATQPNAEEVSTQTPKQLINPYDVILEEGKTIDYDFLIKDFGCSHITPALIERIEKVTGKKAHRFLRRGIFFSHRDLEAILDAYEKGKPFFLYTGRGPSSDSMHLGHLLPFIFTRYLQEAFGVPLVIQITDDEKYFHKGDDKTELEDYIKFGIENCKDIIACGFDIEKTFIFSDTEYMGGNFYRNVCKFQKHLTFNQVRGIFGVTTSDNCGKLAYPAVQAAPCFSNSFPHIFGQRKDILCLIPQGIDQDPYFRMTRDVATKLKYQKPACIHSKFFPSIYGIHAKMSASDPNSTIFLTDKPKEIEKKITSYAYSGGGKTLADHQKFGANIDVDIPYQYLRFFLDDDAELEQIGEKYKKGEMLSSEIKKILVGVLQKLVAEHQEKRSKVTEEMVRDYMKVRPMYPKKPEKVPPPAPEKSEQQAVAEKTEIPEKPVNP
jgi:tryptophanyl-tRNA synthetase